MPLVRPWSPRLRSPPVTARRSGRMTQQPGRPVALTGPRVEADLGIHRVVVLLADARELKNEPHLPSLPPWSVHFQPADTSDHAEIRCVTRPGPARCLS